MCIYNTYIYIYTHILQWSFMGQIVKSKYTHTYIKYSDLLPGKLQSNSKTWKDTDKYLTGPPSYRKLIKLHHHKESLQHELSFQAWQCWFICSTHCPLRPRLDFTRWLVRIRKFHDHSWNSSTVPQLIQLPFQHNYLDQSARVRVCVCGMGLWGRSILLMPIWFP